MKIILSGNPLSTQSIYRYTCIGRFPRLYVTKEGKERKKQYQLEAKNQYKGEVMSGDCDMEVTLFFRDKGKHDADNFNKLVLDSLEGIIYEDDNQVQRLTSIKNYSKENPRIEVEVKIKST